MHEEHGTEIRTKKMEVKMMSQTLQTLDILISLKRVK